MRAFVVIAALAGAALALVAFWAARRLTVSVIAWRERRETRVRPGESFEDWRRRMPWNYPRGGQRAGGGKTT